MRVRMSLLMLALLRQYLCPSLRPRAFMWIQAPRGL